MPCPRVFKADTILCKEMLPTLSNRLMLKLIPILQINYLPTNQPLPGHPPPCHRHLQDPSALIPCHIYADTASLQRLSKPLVNPTSDPVRTDSGP